MKKFFNDFKKFITRGNVIDLAVGVIIGTAFTAIVNSLVKDVIMPFINLLTNGGAGELFLTLRPEQLAEDGTVLVEGVYLTYGNFIQAVINFLLIAIVVFAFVRIINKIQEIADVDKNMCEKVQAKIDNDEELTALEQKWLAKYSKKNPNDAPKKKIPEPPKPVELSSTDKLLTEILEQLKNK